MFEFERRIEDSELQVDALPETSIAKMKTRNRADIGHLIDTLKFMGQIGFLFREHRDSGRLEPISDIKDIYSYGILWETPNLPCTSKNLLLMQHI